MTDPTDAAAPAPADSDDPLDIDAWLDGLTVPETTIHICGSAGLAAVHEDLTERLRIQMRADAAVPEGDRGVDHGAVTDDLTRQVDANAEAMRRASRAFRVRGLTTDENDRLLKEHTQVDPKTRVPRIDGDKLVLAQLSMAIIDPELTPAQVEKMRKRLAAGEFARIMTTVRDLTQGVTDLPL